MGEQPTEREARQAWLSEHIKQAHARFEEKTAAAKAAGDPDGYFEIFACWDEAHPEPAMPQMGTKPKRRPAKPE